MTDETKQTIKLETISVEQFLNRRVIYSSFDLVYLVYVGYYLKTKHNKVLSFTGIQFNFNFDNIKHSKYLPLIMFALDQGYFKNIKKSYGFYEETFTTMLGQEYDENYYFNWDLFAPFGKEINFEYTHLQNPHDVIKRADDNLFYENRVYNFLEVVENRLGYRESNLETAIIMSASEIIVDAIVENKDVNIRAFYIISDTLANKRQGLALVTFAVLSIEPLSKFVNISMSPHHISNLDLGYAAWYTVGVDLNLIKDYSGKEKYDYAKDLYKPGDVILLYSRSVPLDNIQHGDKEAEALQTARFQSLESCLIGVIEHMDEQGVTITTINTRDLRLTTQLEIQALSDDIQRLYLGDENYGVRVSTETISWRLLGVDYRMSDNEYFEPRFFTRLTQGAQTMQKVKVNGIVRTQALSQYETIFRLLIDYGVRFHFGRFIDLYGEGLALERTSDEVDLDADYYYSDQKKYEKYLVKKEKRDQQKAKEALEREFLFAYVRTQDLLATLFDYTIKRDNSIVDQIEVKALRVPKENLIDYHIKVTYKNGKEQTSILEGQPPIVKVYQNVAKLDFDSINILIDEILEHSGVKSTTYSRRIKRGLENNKQQLEQMDRDQMVEIVKQRF